MGRVAQKVKASHNVEALGVQTSAGPSNQVNGFVARARAKQQRHSRHVVWGRHRKLAPGAARPHRHTHAVGVGHAEPLVLLQVNRLDEQAKVQQASFQALLDGVGVSRVELDGHAGVVAV